MDETDLVLAEPQFQNPGPLFGCGRIRLFAFLNEGADPIGLATAGDVSPEATDDVSELLLADHARFYRRSSRRHLVDLADVHLAILGEGQSPRDRRCRHHQQVRWT